MDEDYIQDDFNLSGLGAQVPYYDYALDLILDVESPNEDILTEEQHEMVQSAAEMLYGLIHQRYILSSRGMAAMLEKYKSADFGRCPRVLCGGQPCLPVGQSDIPRSSTVKIFCPKCEDIYFPRSRLQCNVDGAYFGTTFPHLFLLTYLHLKPPKPTQHYVPRIFGFRVRSLLPLCSDVREGLIPNSSPTQIHPSAWQQGQNQQKQAPPAQRQEGAPGQGKEGDGQGLNQSNNDNQGTAGVANNAAEQECKPAESTHKRDGGQDDL